MKDDHFPSVIPAASRSDSHSGDPEKTTSKAGRHMDPGCFRKPAACLRNDKKIRAWVVFSGQADLAWLKILKPCFRHCAVLLNDGRRWITIDPLSNYTDVVVHDVPVDFALPLWMRSRGHIVVPAPIERRMSPAPFALFSCVESVKRILGIHARFIVTPWQLYRHLTKIQTEILKHDEGDLVWEV